MDVATDDQRAWALAPHLVVQTTATSVDWLNPETGTTCRLERDGEYLVLRRAGARVRPVVAGQIRPEDAVQVHADPDSVVSRRAAAHAIVAVDRPGA